jgi:hypothetical protein
MVEVDSAAQPHPRKKSTTAAMELTEIPEKRR